MLQSVVLALMTYSSFTFVVCDAYSPVRKPGNFFDFGTYAGDVTVEESDDGSSGNVALSVKFPFYGHRYNSIFVSIICVYAIMPVFLTRPTGCNIFHT